MDRDDVARFRRNLEKHLRGDFSAEERHRIEERKARTEANVKRIIRNCGGKNPLLGYWFPNKINDWRRLWKYVCVLMWCWRTWQFLPTWSRRCVRRHYLSAYCAFLNSGEIVAAFTLMNDALMISSQTEKEDFIDETKVPASAQAADLHYKKGDNEQSPERIIRRLLYTTCKKRELHCCNSLILKWCQRESNQWHKDFQSFALYGIEKLRFSMQPTELWHFINQQSWKNLL